MGILKVEKYGGKATDDTQRRINSFIQDPTNLKHLQQAFQKAGDREQHQILQTVADIFCKYEDYYNATAMDPTSIKLPVDYHESIKPLFTLLLELMPLGQRQISKQQLYDYMSIIELFSQLPRYASKILDAYHSALIKTMEEYQTDHLMVWSVLSVFQNTLEDPCFLVNLNRTKLLQRCVEFTFKLDVKKDKRLLTVVLGFVLTAIQMYPDELLRSELGKHMQSMHATLKSEKYDLVMLKMESEKLVELVEAILKLTEGQIRKSKANLAKSMSIKEESEQVAKRPKRKSSQKSWNESQNL